MIKTLNVFDPPKTWDELVSLKPKIRHSTAEVDRLPDDLAFYQLYNELVPKEIRLEIIKRLIGDNDYKILKNNFPYLKLIQYLPWVTHYCLWSRVGKLSPNVIDSEITKKFPNKKYFWFENSRETKSVPEIWHCHIFINQKD
jgi:hypothetical protein